MTSTDALSPVHILDLAAKAIQSEQPSLKTPYEAVALIGHACMAAVDFRLVGLGEEHNLGLSSSRAHLFFLIRLVANLNRIPSRESHPPRRLER